MCSPHLSFMMNKFKKIFYKDGMQSHAALAKYFKVNEDELLKVDYDWVTKTIDIFDENNSQNETTRFTPKESHYRAIQTFIDNKVGTKEKLMVWLSKNTNDTKIKEESYSLLSEEGDKIYYKNTKKFNLELVKELFFKYPNLVWRDSNGKRSMA